MSEKFSRGLSTTELNKVSSGFRKMLQKKFPEIIVDPNNLPKLDVISTGSYKLDALLRIGGLTRGRILEVYGGNFTLNPTLW